MRDMKFHKTLADGGDLFDPCVMVAKMNK